MFVKQRKPTSSFVSDIITGNLTPTPRTEIFHIERGPPAMNSHGSKTNFIGNSVLLEGPRAVAVTEFGEKHSILLDEDLVISSSNNFSNIPTRSSQPISECSLSANSANVGSLTNPKLRSTKKSKITRRLIHPKTRTTFTPRNLQATNPSTSGGIDQTKFPHLNVQTQTENRTAHIYEKRSVPLPHVPVSHKYEFEQVGDGIDSSRRQPLRILPIQKTDNKSFLDLRNIASILTLITVVSWLFTTFFELEGILDIFSKLIYCLQLWFSKREQSMTKAQMAMQYIQSFWY